MRSRISAQLIDEKGESKCDLEGSDDRRLFFFALF